MIKHPLSVNEFSTPKRENRFQERASASTKSSASSPFKLIEDENESPLQCFQMLTDSDARCIKKTTTDRYIPLRNSSKLSSVFSKVYEEIDFPDDSSKRCKGEESQQDHINNVYLSYLKAEVLGIASPNPTSNFQNKNFFSFSYSSGFCDSESQLSRFDLKKIVNFKEVPPSRKIPKNPYKILDAPALQDDFYLNLLDWSESNLLAVGLGSSLYLWRASNGIVLKVCDLGVDNLVTAVSWDRRDSLLGIGTNQGNVEIWDINKLKLVRTMEGHSARVGSLAWGNSCLISGSRDKTILLRDLRSQNHFHERLTQHKQEVCGLKWSFDDQMFCSGGNDNKLYIWTPKSKQPIFKSNAHKAAVKALAWSPHQHGLLASGGGTADRTIRFWNAHTSRMTSCVDTGSQVCNLMFSKNSNELISTHGYTNNQIHIWSYPKMQKVSTLMGHSYRVLYLAMSPDGRSIVTGAGDETLRFWDLYPKPEDTKTLLSEAHESIPKISIR